MNVNDSLSENEYFVEKILDKKVVDGEVRYLIKWEGWPLDQSTWEPRENLNNIKHLIESFERKPLEYKEKETKRKVGRPSLKKKLEEQEISREREIHQSEKVFSEKPKEKIENNFKETSQDRETNHSEKNLSQKPQEILNKKNKEISHPKEMEKPILENEYVELLKENAPEEVTGVKKDKNNGILCMVKFKVRTDGLQKENVYIPSAVLKEMYPKVLIKFYESKIKFIDK
jgi:hypothetical protein